MLALAAKIGESEGLVWPNRSLRHMHQELREKGKDYGSLPEAPSTSKFRSARPSMHGYLTPENAAVCDYDSIQANLLAYAMRKSNPGT